MLRDPVFCNSVRGFVAEISHFGPLQARPAARRSKRPVPRTVPAARLSHPACLRLPPAAPRPPSVPLSASPSRARFRLSACRPLHTSDYRAAAHACRPCRRPHRRPRARFRLPACRLPHTSDCRPLIHARRPRRRPHRRPPRTVPAVRLPSPTCLRLPPAAPRPPPVPPSASPSPAHGSGCPPRVLPVAVRVARVARSPITPRPPPDGSAFPAPASTGRPALFFWKIRNVSKIALQPYAAVI